MTFKSCHALSVGPREDFDASEKEFLLLLDPLASWVRSIFSSFFLILWVSLLPCLLIIGIKMNRVRIKRTRGIVPHRADCWLLGLFCVHLRCDIMPVKVAFFTSRRTKLLLRKRRKGDWDLIDRNKETAHSNQGLIMSKKSIPTPQ